MLLTARSLQKVFRFQHTNFLRYQNANTHRLRCCYSTNQSTLSPEVEDYLEKAKIKGRSHEKIIQTQDILVGLAKCIQATEKSALGHDTRFQDLLKNLENDLRFAEPLKIISILKTVEKLGVEEDGYVVKNLENAVLWVARSCSIKELIRSFSFFASRSSSPQKKRMVDDILTIVERRWVEFQEGHHLQAMLLHSSLLSPDLVGKLEDRLQDNVEDIPVNQLVEILSTYAKSTRGRNIPVLRSLGFHISKNRTFLNIKEISDVLFAFNKLSYKNQDTIERICYALEPLIVENDNLSVIRSILTSLGQLKFRQSEVLDKICDWYNTRIEENKTVESRDMSTLLLTLANLNHIPLDKEPFLQKLESRLKYEDFKDLKRGNSIWIDIVWSLLVLKRPIAQHAYRVLSPEFIKSLIDGEKLQINTSKLLNINEAVRSLGESYTGPRLSNDVIAELLQLSAISSGNKIKFRKFVMETLSTLFPPPRFAHEDVKTKFGVNIDVEVIADSKAKPLMIEPYSIQINPENPPKELPADASRMAILTTPFQECLISGEMSGATSLAVSLLQANGYKTLVIDHKTIDRSMKAISRIQKLDVLVKQVLEKKDNDVKEKMS